MHPGQSDETARPGPSFPRITLTVARPERHSTADHADQHRDRSGPYARPQPREQHRHRLGADLTALADLAIVKGRSEPLEAGRDVTYTLNVTNLGPSTSRSRTHGDRPVPPGTTFVSASGTGWACPPDNAAIASITCTRGSDLLAGTAAPQITVVLRIGSGFTGDLTNTAVVTGTTPDPVPGNNTSTVTGTVTTTGGCRNREDPRRRRRSRTSTATSLLERPTTPTLFTVHELRSGRRRRPRRRRRTRSRSTCPTPAPRWMSPARGRARRSRDCATAPIQTVTCTLTGGLALGQTRAVRIGIAVSTAAPTRRVIHEHRRGHQRHQGPEPDATTPARTRPTSHPRRIWRSPRRRRPRRSWPARTSRGH